MKIRFMALALVAGAAVSSANAQTLLTYWNFNASTAQSGAGTMGTLNSTAANAGVYSGSAAMTLSSGLSYNTTAVAAANGDVGTFSGAVLSAIPADVANNPGGALAVRGSLSGSSSANSADNNGEYVQFSVSTLGYNTIGIKWDGRGTGTGFGQTASPNKILVSTDGINFSQLATYTSTQTTFQTYSFAGTGALDNQSTIYVRLQLFGATTGTGNNRIDNFQISGVAVPTPGSLALLGLGGLVAGRRRR